LRAFTPRNDRGAGCLLTSGVPVRLFNAMVERAIDPTYLEEQYGTEDRLRIRIEAHARYSERTDNFYEWVVERLQPQPGAIVVDVGCGVGSIHPFVCARGVRAILGVDASQAMVEASQRQANQLNLPVVTVHADAQELLVLARKAVS
jgi:tRNA/tmRNA/rRNA uracil-C5-methylase (TrmA/RlmC/RlmD family)